MNKKEIVLEVLKKELGSKFRKAKDFHIENIAKATNLLYDSKHLSFRINEAIEDSNFEAWTQAYLPIEKIDQHYQIVFRTHIDFFELTLEAIADELLDLNKHANRTKTRFNF